MKLNPNRAQFTFTIDPWKNSDDDLCAYLRSMTDRFAALLQSTGITVVIKHHLDGHYSPDCFIAELSVERAAVVVGNETLSDAAVELPA